MVNQLTHNIQLITKKSGLLTVFFGSFFWMSCHLKKEETQQVTSDKINNVSIIIDDQLWDGEIGDTLRNKFASPVLGLPQEEPLFTINQYPLKLLEGYMTNSRNIMVIKKESKSKFSHQINEYAQPQNVFHISGNSVKEIIDTIEKNSNIIIGKLKKTEINEIQNRNKNNVLRTKKIANKFHITLEIPKNFSIVRRKAKFMWFKNEILGGSISIVIYELPFKNFTQNEVIRIRDSIGSLYIHGNEMGTEMKTEDSYSPYSTWIQMAHKRAYETRGTWIMKNDFMSGPFLNYFILDQKNKRIMVLEGFCYAPSKPKRDLMLELEAIIKTIQFKK